MNKTFLAVAIIIITVLLALGVSALLDLEWIKKELSREIVIYVLMVVIVVIGFITFRGIFK